MYWKPTTLDVPMRLDATEDLGWQIHLSPDRVTVAQRCSLNSLSRVLRFTLSLSQPA
jgi:hypothetical protein